MKNKGLLKYLMFAIILVALIPMAIMITNKTSANDNLQTSKAEDELEYISNEILYMINELNNEEVNWKTLESRVENLYETWVGTTVDLVSLNVSSDNILAFNSNLDSLLTSIQNKNKPNSAICLANLEALIPKYMSETLSDTEKIKLETIKSLVISAYSLASSEKWNEATEVLSNAETNFNDLMLSQSDMNEFEQTNFNRSYIVLKELIKTTKEKDIQNFLIKYTLFIKTIK